MIILTNIDKASFAGTLQALSPFVPDLTLTAQEIGSCKPNEQNFRYMLTTVAKEFGVKPDEVLVTAQSLLHDHQPAQALGLKGSWIDRAGAVMGVGEVVKDVKYDFRFPTLGEMAAAVEACT
jgi:FMN phosphatase YigB (HAD superfamily)